MVEGSAKDSEMRVEVDDRLRWRRSLKVEVRTLLTGSEKHQVSFRNESNHIMEYNGRPKL